jgi:uncharacterized protein YgiM (DUF1202 family)
MLKKTLFFFLIMFVISSCSKSAEGLTPPAASSVTPGATQPALTFPTIPPITPTSSASATPFTTFTVMPSVDNLKLRVNPGYMFDALRMVHQTDSLTVLGKAPGDEWTYVQAADGVEGWVFTQLLTSTIDLNRVPLHEPKDVVLIKGKVVDASGASVPGVGFTIKQGNAADAPNTVANSDANGEFYGYLPVTTTGTWTVAYTSISCDSVVWSDTTCTSYKSGYTGIVSPETLTITLPQLSPLVFTWK